MFRVTLVNLDPSGRTATAEAGPRYLGELGREELLALLEAFRTLDAIQNVEADPEIVIEVRGRKHVVRTGQGRLLLHDPRDSSQPSLVLTAEQIVAEVDGSAAAARSKAPFVPLAVERAAASEPVRPAPPRRLGLRLALGTAAAGLLASPPYPALNAQLADQAIDFTPLGDETALAEQRRALVGVYMTGAQPGHHGIALNEDGTLRIFLINAQSPPSSRVDAFRVGHSDGKLSLQHHQPGGLMLVTGKDTLLYAGETYRRIP